MSTVYPPATAPAGEAAQAASEIRRIAAQIEQFDGFPDVTSANAAIKTLMVASVAVVEDRAAEAAALKASADDLHARLIAMEDAAGPAAAHMLREQLSNLIDAVHGRSSTVGILTAADTAAAVMENCTPATDAMIGRGHAYQGRSIATIGALLKREADSAELRRLGVAAHDRVSNLLVMAAGALAMMEATVREAGQARDAAIKTMLDASMGKTLVAGYE